MLGLRSTVIVLAVLPARLIFRGPWNMVEANLAFSVGAGFSAFAATLSLLLFHTR